MKAAVLCSGPSVATTWKGRAGYERVLGVNRAAWRDNCDWWVFTDPSMVDLIPPRWFTMTTTADYARGLGKTLTAGAPSEYEHATRDGLVPDQMNGTSWWQFTSGAALVRAYLDGAKLIDVYGYDATNAADFDGVTVPGTDRRDQRWADEAAMWSRVTAWLADRGCEVRRIQP